LVLKQASLKETPSVSDRELRLADAEDAEVVSTLLLRAFVEYEALYTPEGFRATTPTAPEVLRRMKEGPMWLVLVDGVVAGTAATVFKDDSLYIRGMAVLPDARGQRVGHLLLEQIERYAVEHNCKRLFLSTTPFLSQAIRPYQHFGFQRTEEEPHDLFGTPLFTMEKILDRTT
jgi:GNAT superfamily N-acetyltransferase